MPVYFLQISGWYFLAGFVLLSLAFFLYIQFTKHKNKKVWIHHGDRNWKITRHKSPHPAHHSVFLIGDSGAPTLTHPDPNLTLLHQKLIEAGEDSTVVFLGDLIYPVGLPVPGTKLHETAEKRLLAQLKTLDGYPGNPFFISGNHDWNKSREGGWESVQRESVYIESYLDRKDVYLPPGACPGPVEVDLTDNLVMIVINTSWFVHRGPKPEGEKDGCVASEAAFFDEFHALIEENKHKQIIIAAHHPLYSQSLHGGKFPLKSHIFPLTELKRRLYIPLPVLGSIYPLYRKYWGASEDMSHPKYGRLRRKLLNIINQYKNLIYVAGHDHNLQYMVRNRNHHIVSGSGSKVTYVKRSGNSRFVHAHKGFFKLDLFIDGSVKLEVWEPDASGAGKMVYSKHIIGTTEHQ